MSNPIADTAEYFARWRQTVQEVGDQDSHRPGSSTATMTPRGVGMYGPHPTPSESVHHDSTMSDARSQWLRVLNRISFLNPLDTPTAVAADEQLLSDDESVNVDRDTFELMRSAARENRHRSRHHSLNVSTSATGAVRGRDDEPTAIEEQDHDQEEKLPSAYELENDQVYPLSDEHNVDEESNYFTHPFKAEEPAVPDSDDSSIQQPPPVLKSAPTTRTGRRLDSENSSMPTMGEYDDGRIIKDKWDRTLDKLKLIANLQSPLPPSPAPAQTHVMLGPSHTLATYYPPAFDPIFAAFAKDEYGRKLPPILLQCIYLNVTDSEYLYGTGQWVFRIELQYGDVKWVIRRGIADFVALHIKLKVKSNLYDYVPDPPVFPNQLANLLDTAKSTIAMYYRGDEPEPPPSVSTPSATHQHQQHHDDGSSIKSKVALNRRTALTQYLRALLLRAHVTVSYDICEFLELSAISIVQDMGWKGKEGYLRNRINYVSPRCCQIWKTHRWSTEWIILRDSYMAFCTDTASSTPTDVLLFDNGLKIDIQEPRVYLGSYHISISNESRKIEIKGTKREVDQWLESMEKVRNESPWVQNHRFGSFAPVRANAKVKWFVDAENHFNAVAEAILSAKVEIYIADWWLTPELYLRRPPEENEDFRLDRLLHRKAVEGVKIYIVVYKEMSLALTIDSVHTKQWLQNLHPNIIVQRHPDHTFSNDNTVLFWSHHEKIVVVDNRLAFIGGLDLCFGRYDTHSHSLSDYPAEGHDREVFPGQDYSNPRVKDFVDVAQFGKTLVDRKTTPRMPWHDVTLGVVGPIARDIARHFIQRWNFLKSTKSMHRRNLPFLMPKGEYVAARDESNFTGTCRVQLLRSSSRWSSDVEREHSIYNAYMECIAHSKHYIYIENQFFISTTQDDKLLRNKIAQALVERIRRAHGRGEKFRVYVVIPLVPAFEGDLASSEASSARTVMHFQYVTISRGGSSIVEKLKEYGIDADQYISWFSLRNYGKIKTNKNTPAAASPQPPNNDSGSVFGDEAAVKDPFDDASTHQHLYPHLHLHKLHTNESTASTATASSVLGGQSTLNPVDTSNSSRRGSSTSSNTSPAVDDDRYDYVSELLYIHDKLMIVDDRIVLMGSANINDRSQLGNRDSEIAMLVEDTEMVPSFMNGKEYKAAKFAHTLRMQLWKEHLGLLNFEKWSQLLQDEDEKQVETLDIPQSTNTTNTHAYPSLARSHNNAQDIRTIEADEPVKMLDRASRTFSFYDTFKTHHHAKRHDAAALDPLSDHTYNNIWLKRATTNTHIYRQLFRCVPDDTVHTYEQHRKFIPDPLKVKTGHVADPNLAEQEICEQLDQIRGHLVLFPKDYLKDENLLQGTIIDTMTPMIIFT
ncbi:60S ribosomal protein L21A [Mucor velutinosus]|uniref:Phospholipase n=1 Tax=Mucor velutinosus TaxID=708070 RepID=A0AAN7DMT7_9FUNG|nr:60S ribosomal protein L21A [Mucor velutinosus]